MVISVLLWGLLATAWSQEPPTDGSYEVEVEGTTVEVPPECPPCDCPCAVDDPRRPPVVVDETKPRTGALKVTPYAAPGYSPEVGGMLSLGALFGFSLQPGDPDLTRSSIPVAAGISTTGALLFSALPQLFLPNDKFRITGNVYFKYMADNYWGVGYDAGRALDQGDDTAYKRLWWQINPRFLWQFRPRLFLGGELDFNQTVATDMNATMAVDPWIVETGTNNYNGGIGAVFQFDSRDMPQNAFKGLFFEAKIVGYGPWLGSDNLYAVIGVEMRHYVTLSKKRYGSTVSWWIRNRSIVGDAPWSELSLVGSPFDLRGYYWGRFRDRTGTTAVVEYRYMFGAMKNPKRPGYSRHGIVVWGGIGFLGSEFLDGDLLPNLGVGYRFEVQPRMNVRLDVGYGIDNSVGFYVNFLESF